MALLTISEPDQANAQPTADHYAVGIDLGTTHSLVACVIDGAAQVLAEEFGQCLLPSVVHYLANGQCEVGAIAQQALIDDSANTVSSVKRLIGRGYEDIQGLADILPYQLIPGESGMVWLDTCAGKKSPVEVSAEILKILKRRAEKIIPGTFSGAVITVPAYFDEAQRQATKDAAQLAGIPVLRLLNEPTAAAVSYGLDHEEEGIYAVYDLGGGTFDISILRLTKGVFEVLATGGNAALGGDDFDRAIVQGLLEEKNITLLNTEHYCHLLITARQVKEQLTEKNVAAFIENNTSHELTREQFNQWIAPLVDRSIVACKKTLRDADIELSEIKQVILVGGATRTPLVKTKITQWFGRAPLTDLDPDRVVALGAAWQAHALMGNASSDHPVLLDVTPLSLGVETMGGLVEKIIPRNSPIPTAKTQTFTTFRDGQTAMALHIVQGESERVEINRSLARFELTGISPLLAGAARIRVTFQVDADGLLLVSAMEVTTGIAASIQVKPSYGLTEQQIAAMLKNTAQ